MPANRLLDLDLLRTFLAVVHTGSLTAAAKALHRTQSATSMQMQRLEEQLGCTLLYRQRAGASPTADGAWLLARAQQLLALNDEVFAERKLARVAGLVRIGSVEHYATVVLPALLAQFCRKYPDVQFDLQIGIPASMRPRLGLDYDLVIGMGPQGAAVNSGVPGTTVLARSDTVWGARRSTTPGAGARCRWRCNLKAPASARGRLPRWTVRGLRGVRPAVAAAWPRSRCRCAPASESAY